MIVGRRWFAVVVAALAAAVLAVGCGGSGGGAAGASVPEAAALVPASAPVFISVTTAPDSEQWQLARQLVERFPGGAEALAQLPAGLGPEVGVAVLALGGAETPPVALVARPEDPEAFETSLAEGADVPVWRVLDGGWYVVADTEAVLSRFIAEAESAPLSESESFRAALETLPGDSLGLLYVNGATLGQALASQLEQAGSPLGGSLDPLGGRTLEWLALVLTAEPEGMRLEGVARPTDAPELASFSPELTALVPDDALAYASFGDVSSSVEALLDAMSAQEQDLGADLAQVELALGVSLEQDLLPLFEGEHALFVRPALPTPEVTLVLSPTDPPQALATLDKIVGGVPLLVQATGGEAPYTVTETTIAGVSAKQLEFEGEDVLLVYALVGDNLVLSTAAKGIADLAAGGGGLADDEGFRQASEAAGVPDETSGLLYVNLEEALDIVQLLGGDAAPDVEGLRPLRSIVLAAAGEDDGDQRLFGFVTIGAS